MKWILNLNTSLCCVATLLGSLLIAYAFRHEMNTGCDCVHFMKRFEGASEYETCQSASSQEPAAFNLVNMAKQKYDPKLGATFQKLADRMANADDSELVQLVKKLLHSPKKQLKLSRGVKPTIQTRKILNLLNQLENGTFVECGGFDGELSSATLYLEVSKHWTGLLIEPSPHYYTQILGRNRNVYSINGCLSQLSYFSQANFLDLGSQSNKVTSNQQEGSSVVPCFPLETLLLALDWRNLNFLSLDVEGAELEILRTIPWNQFAIDTISAEYAHGQLGKKGLTDYLTTSGFKLRETLKYDRFKEGVHIRDLVFSKVKT